MTWQEIPRATPTHGCDGHCVYTSHNVYFYIKVFLQAIDKIHMEVYNVCISLWIITIVIAGRLTPVIRFPAALEKQSPGIFLSTQYIF